MRHESLVCVDCELRFLLQPGMLLVVNVLVREFHGRFAVLLGDSRQGTLAAFALHLGGGSSDPVLF